MRRIVNPKGFLSTASPLAVLPAGFSSTLSAFERELCNPERSGERGRDETETALSVAKQIVFSGLCGGDPEAYSRSYEASGTL